jgi:hypothetical protein
MYKKALSHITNLVLIILLGMSPVQTINAAVSNCVKSGNDMQSHKMPSHKMASHMNMQHDMSQAKSGSKHDCCKQEKTCHLVHCASVTAAIMDSNPIVHVHYNINKISQAHRISLVEFYPPSLYRPPKA